MTKKELRAMVSARKKLLSREEIESYSKKVCDILIQQPDVVEGLGQRLFFRMVLQQQEFELFALFLPFLLEVLPCHDCQHQQHDGQASDDIEHHFMAVGFLGHLLCQLLRAAVVVERRHLLEFV